MRGYDDRPAGLVRNVVHMSYTLADLREPIPRSSNSDRHSRRSSSPRDLRNCNLLKITPLDSRELVRSQTLSVLPRSARGGQEYLRHGTRGERIPAILIRRGRWGRKVPSTPLIRSRQPRESRRPRGGIHYVSGRSRLGSRGRPRAPD